MKLIDPLIKASGAGAALALALIGAIILAQVIARLAGQQIPAADDFAAWAMAASAFLALPYAMRHGDHIRVTLILQRLPVRLQRGVETLATALGFGLAAWAAWHAALFVHDSWQYDEVAQGLLRVPLWMPQLCMPVGLGLLALMLGDRLWCCLAGRPLGDEATDAARTE